MAQKTRPQAETLSGLPQPNFTGFSPAPIIAKRAPTSSDTGYPIGQNWVDKTNGNAYELLSVGSGSANWALLGGAAASGVQTINTLSPTLGNITIAGTANQVAVANLGSTVTLSTTGPYAPATYTANTVLVGNGSSSIAVTNTGSVGQVLIGTGASAPQFGALGVNSGLTIHGLVIAQANAAFTATGAGTAGQVLTSNGAGADPTFQASGGGGLTFNAVAGTTQALVANNGYYCQNGALTTLTLPATCVAGAIIQVQGVGAGGWIIAQGAGQSITVLGSASTTGAGGSVAGVEATSGITILCTTANTGFTATSSIGNLTIT